MPVVPADVVWLLGAQNLARLRIGLLHDAPFVPAFCRDEAATLAHRVSPHRFRNGFFDARVERELRWLFLFPPVGNESPESRAEREHAAVVDEQRHRIRGRYVEAAPERVAGYAADPPGAFDRGLFRADVAAAHPIWRRSRAGTRERRARAPLRRSSGISRRS